MKSATAEETDFLCKVLSVTPIGTLPVVSTAHRDLSKCPCDQSKSSWKNDCSKCKQFWHVNLLGLNGLLHTGTLVSALVISQKAHGKLIAQSVNSFGMLTAWV